MKLERDWLWDRKTSLKKARFILNRPENEHFLPLASLLLSRKNTPKEVFRYYLKPRDFLGNWQKIKRQMRKNSWNDPRVEFWQAVYEKLKEKYEKRGIAVSEKILISKPKDGFCKFVADKIKAVRKQKGITQEELSRRLRVSQQIISRIETGSENISLLTLKKIVDNLGAELQLEIS